MPDPARYPIVQYRGLPQFYVPRCRVLRQICGAIDEAAFVVRLVVRLVVRRFSYCSPRHLGKREFSTGHLAFRGKTKKRWSPKLQLWHS